MHLVSTSYDVLRLTHPSHPYYIARMSRNSNAFKLAASITLPIIVSCTFVYIFYRQKKKFQSKSSIRQIKSDRGFTVYEDKNQGAVEVEHQASAWNSLG